MSLDSSRVYRRVAGTAAVLVFALIVLGGIVRITGSGMGCGEHWPRCNGEWFPPLDLPTLIEMGHRWAAALVSIFVLALAVVAWRRHRREPQLRNPAYLALTLLVIQILLGPVIVKLQLPPQVVIIHLANAMILLAVLLVAALRAGVSVAEMDRRRDETAVAEGYGATALASYRLTAFGAALGFAVVLLGALVANYHAGLLCLGFPLCSGKLLPPPTFLATLPWVHRLAAFGFLAYMAWLVIRLRTRRARAARPCRVAVVTLGLTVAQIGVAAAMVLQLLPTSLRGLHLMMGTAIWATLVVLVWASRVTSPSPFPASQYSVLAL